MIDHIQISKRLEAIASYIKQDSFFADIGSDHAYLPCYACLKQPNIRAIAGEVNKGPWERAKETVADYRLLNRIEVRLGNGLEIIDDNDKIDTVTIAGMGGSLIESILAAGQERLTNVHRIIAQPNNYAYAVRKFLSKNNYNIVDELIIEENGHIYEIIISDKADQSGTELSLNTKEKQWLFGPHLLQEKSSVFLKKWQAEYQKTKSVIEQMQQAKSLDNDKISQLEKRLQWIGEVLD